jgi:acetylornithine deacetylase/succinyl-diaminopimelate desuccinylase family protein
LSRRDYVRSILAELIEEPTVNPPGQKYIEIQNKIRKQLESIGARARIFQFARGKPNLVASFGHGHPNLLLSSHIDVVASGSAWRRDPFKATEHAGKIFGRGTADAKGSIAAMIAAMADIADKIQEMKGSVTFASTVDEETGGIMGLGALVKKKRVVPDFAVIGEPTDLNVAFCEKGVYWCEIAVEGKAAHAATPHLGINAIEEMSNVVLRLQLFRPRQKHTFLGRPTRNVGLITGGTAINTVADHCTISLDRRLLPGETTRDARNEVKKELLASSASFPGLKYQIRDILAAEPFEQRPQEKFIQLVLKAIREATGTEPRLKGMSGFTDARHLLPGKNCTAVILGPGSISQAHVANEYVPRKQLEDAAKVYSRIIEKALICSRQSFD